MAPNALRAVEERHIFSGQPEVGFSRTRKWLVFTVKKHVTNIPASPKNYSLKSTFKGVIEAADGDFRVRENDGFTVKTLRKPGRKFPIRKLVRRLSRNPSLIGRNRGRAKVFRGRENAVTR